MKLLRISGISTTGRKIIEDAGTDIWKAVRTQELVRLKGRECLLIEPFSDDPADQNHVMRHSHWMLVHRDKDLEIEERFEL